MVFSFATILEYNLTAYVAHHYEEFEVDGGPIVRRPINSVSCFDEQFVLSWHHDIAFDREARSVGALLLHSGVAHPKKTRWFAFELHGFALDLS